MKNGLILIGVLLVLGGLVYMVQFNTDSTESAHQSAQEADVASLMETLSKNNSGSEDTNAAVKEFFRFFNNDAFSAVHDTLIHKDAKVLKNIDYFINTLSEIKMKTGDYATGSQRGFGMGTYIWGTDQTGKLLEETITLNTKTIKWQGEFENGEFYFEFKFARDSNKLIEIEVADDPLFAKFKRTI